MLAVIYAKQSDQISIYQQFNACAAYANRKGYSIKGKVLDFEGTSFHEAVNKTIANDLPCALMIYSKDMVFKTNDDYLFYRIYLEKLGKALIDCN